MNLETNKGVKGQQLIINISIYDQLIRQTRKVHFKIEKQPAPSEAKGWFSQITYDNYRLVWSSL